MVLRRRPEERRQGPALGILRRDPREPRPGRRRGRHPRLPAQPQGEVSGLRRRRGGGLRLDGEAYRRTRRRPAQGLHRRPFGRRLPRPARRHGPRAPQAPRAVLGRRGGHRPGQRPGLQPLHRARGARPGPLRHHGRRGRARLPHPQVAPADPDDLRPERHAQPGRGEHVLRDDPQGGRTHRELLAARRRPRPRDGRT